KRRSLSWRPAALEIPEQVADLVVPERIEDTLGHQGGLGRLHLLDLVAGDDGPLLLAVEEGDGLVALLDHEAGEDAPVVQGDRLRLILLADQGAGVDEAGEEEVQVAPLDAGEVGADLLAIAEEAVAARAGLLEDELPPRGAPLVPLGEHAADLGDALGL